MGKAFQVTMFFSIDNETGGPVLMKCGAKTVIVIKNTDQQVRAR